MIDLSTDPAAAAAYTALSSAGGQVYVVGGAIRDTLAGGTPKDIDLMVRGLPADDVMAVLEHLPGSVNYTGEDFGVFRYKIDKHEVEIALPRTERSTGPLHNQFDVQADHNLSVEDDLYRRDFTVNAMAYDPFTGQIIDPFGGQVDLEENRLRLVNPEALKDDPLRIVRALVSTAKRGLWPDEDLLASMRENASSIKNLPSERVQMELDKLLAGKDPAGAIRLAQQEGLLEYLIPELSSTFGFSQNNQHHDLDVGSHILSVLDVITELTDDPDLRLAALLHDVAKPESYWEDEKGQGHFYKKVHEDGTEIGEDHDSLGAQQAQAFMTRMAYPARRIERVTKLIEMHMWPYFNTLGGARRFLARLNGDVKMAEDLITLREADSSGKGREMDESDRVNIEKARHLLQAVVDAQDAVTVKDLAITGKDLLNAGIPQGPEIGRTLRAMLQDVIEDPSINTREGLMAWLQNRTAKVATEFTDISPKAYGSSFFCWVYVGGEVDKLYIDGVSYHFMLIEDYPEIEEYEFAGVPILYGQVDLAGDWTGVPLKIEPYSDLKFRQNPKYRKKLLEPATKAIEEWLRRYDYIEPKEANIFDPISEELDQTVFKGDEPQAQVINFIEQLYKRAFNSRFDALDDELVFEICDLYLTGSLTTYQYGETSDCDVSVIPDYAVLGGLTGMTEDEVRKELIALSIDHLDGTFLPGTTHPIQFFNVAAGIKPQDLYKPGERSAWSFREKKWLVPPEKERSKDIATELPDLYARASEMAEKMTEMLDHEPARAQELWHQVHKKRQLDERSGLGDYSEGNIVYKWLLHEGLFDRIRNELHEYIAATKTARATMFHATSSDRVESILQQGLLQSKNGQDWDDWETSPGIYFFESYDNALNIGGSKFGMNAVVLAVDVTDIPIQLDPDFIPLTRDNDPFSDVRNVSPPFEERRDRKNDFIRQWRDETGSVRAWRTLADVSPDRISVAANPRQYIAKTAKINQFELLDIVQITWDDGTTDFGTVTAFRGWTSPREDYQVLVAWDNIDLGEQWEWASDLEFYEWTNSKTATKIVKVDEVDEKYNSLDIPLVYDPANGTVYIGERGSHHWPCVDEAIDADEAKYGPMSAWEHLVLGIVTENNRIFWHPYGKGRPSEEVDQAISEYLGIKTAINWPWKRDKELSPSVQEWLDEKMLDLDDDQWWKPEKYRTPEHWLPKPLTYIEPDEYDPSVEYRWSYHPSTGVHVWPATDGYHRAWESEFGIMDDPGREHADKPEYGYAGGVIEPEAVVEYHAMFNQALAIEGVQAVQEWLGPNRKPSADVAAPSKFKRPNLAGFEKTAFAFISFIFDPTIDKLYMEGSDINHWRIVEEHDLDYWELIENGAIFGVVWGSNWGQPFRLEMNYSDFGDSMEGDGYDEDEEGNLYEDEDWEPKYKTDKTDRIKRAEDAVRAWMAEYMRKIDDERPIIRESDVLDEPFPWETFIENTFERMVSRPDLKHLWPEQKEQWWSMIQDQERVTREEFDRAWGKAEARALEQIEVNRRNWEELQQQLRDEPKVVQTIRWGFNGDEFIAVDHNDLSIVHPDMLEKWEPEYELEEDWWANPPANLYFGYADILSDGTVELAEDSIDLPVYDIPPKVEAEVLKRIKNMFVESKTAVVTERMQELRDIHENYPAFLWVNGTTFFNAWGHAQLLEDPPPDLVLELANVGLDLDDSYEDVLFRLYDNIPGKLYAGRVIKDEVVPWVEPQPSQEILDQIFEDYQGWRQDVSLSKTAEYLNLRYLNKEELNWVAEQVGIEAADSWQPWEVSDAIFDNPALREKAEGIAKGLGYTGLRVSKVVYIPTEGGVEKDIRTPFVWHHETQTLYVGTPSSGHFQILNYLDDEFDLPMDEDMDVMGVLTGDNAYIYGVNPPDEMVKEVASIANEVYCDWTMNYDERLASPRRVLFHVSDPDLRESILLNGLDPSYDQTGHGAVFLAEEPLFAEGFDEWRVNAVGLNLTEDITTPGFDWWMTYDPIPPERLQLMEPEEKVMYAASNEEFNVIYDPEKDRIFLGTVSATEYPKAVIIGKYKDGNVNLVTGHAWLNPEYFRKLWRHSFPNRPLHNITVQRDGEIHKTARTFPVVQWGDIEHRWGAIFIFDGTSINVGPGQWNHYELADKLDAEITDAWDGFEYGRGAGWITPQGQIWFYPGAEYRQEVAAALAEAGYASSADFKVTSKVATYYSPEFIAFVYDDVTGKVTTNEDVGCSWFHPAIVEKSDEIQDRLLEKPEALMFGWAGKNPQKGERQAFWGSVEMSQGDKSLEDKATKAVLEKLPDVTFPDEFVDEEWQ